MPLTYHVVITSVPNNCFNIANIPVLYSIPHARILIEWSSLHDNNRFIILYIGEEAVDEVQECCGVMIALSNVDVQDLRTRHSCKYCMAIDEVSR